jgi:hypothetical protein
MPGITSTPWQWPSRRRDDARPQTDSETGYNLSTSSDNKAPRRRPTICGFRRKIFFIIIGGGIFIAVAAVAIGVGAGLAFGRKNNTDTS